MIVFKAPKKELQNLTVFGWRFEQQCHRCFSSKTKPTAGEQWVLQKEMAMKVDFMNPLLF